MSDQSTTVCSECGGAVFARSLCRKHYKRVNYAEWTEANPGKQRARVAKWRASNLERARELARAGHQRRKEQRNEESRIYRQENLERMREMNRAWAHNNPEKMRATNTARRAAKQQAIPSWAGSEFDEFFIKEAYDLAVRRTKLTGAEWHVDHIVPLRSRLVCGLHCAANLRVITSAENHSKGNRIWPDMPTADTASSPRRQHEPKRQSIQPHALASRSTNVDTRGAYSDGHPESMRTQH